MTDNLTELRARFIRMTLVSTALAFVAAGFAVAHFRFGVGWALWAFVGFIAAAFGAQIWFVRGFGRGGKGS
jgi:multidrug transporter EmrE-like cation transporter